MTRPGTRLRFGQKAVVPVRQYDLRRDAYTEGVLGIVVRQIQHIPGSELDGAFDRNSWAVLKRQTAYYAKIVITNESGSAMWLGTPRFEGLTSSGESPHTVVLGGEVPACAMRGSPVRFDHRGAQLTTCELVVSPPSRPIRQIRYLEAPYGQSVQGVADARFNRYYNLGPITWY
jgi:hypothetical protein